MKSNTGTVYNYIIIYFKYLLSVLLELFYSEKHNLYIAVDNNQLLLSKIECELYCQV